MMRAAFWIGILVVGVGAQTLETKGKVTEVTLYRGQALVTRAIPLDDRTGPVEVVVGGIPSLVVPESLFAEGEDGVDVRAVRYRTRAVGEEPREEVRALDAKLAELQRGIAANQSEQGVLKKRLEYLDRVEQFVAPTAQGDLAKGVLDAEALERLVLFGFEQRSKATAELLELGNAAVALQQEAALVERKRAEITSRSATTVNEAVVFLEKRQRGAAGLRLSYLVNGCGWAPAYNIRARERGGAIQVEYNALIRQMTGESWVEVALTLSTATPALSAEGPGLAPLAVELTRAAQKQGELADSTRQYQTLVGGVELAQAAILNTMDRAANLGAAFALNRAANDFQVFELNLKDETLSNIRRSDDVDTSGPALTYALPGRVSLSSRRDQQMVRVARNDLKGGLSHVATPILSPHVYREAEMVNTSGFDYLGGPVSVYLEGRFVGRAEIPTVARGQSFVVGLGADSRLQAKRELLSREEKFQGGNRIIELEVRITLENFHDEALSVELLDRVPYDLGRDDLGVTLGKMSDEMSKDPFHLREERPNGILRWSVEVPASAAGEKARVVTYAYTMEFDRNLQLSAPGTAGAKQLRDEFERIQRRRALK